MNYNFICPKCAKEEIVSMKISEYKSDGHICKNCGAELKRDPKSFCSSFVVNVDGFCGKLGKNH